jgi:radical SAM superfamily enzyme YgiQ (UPF0313 family)
MKILLIYANTNRYLSPPPIGLSFIVSPLVEKGHDVKILDLMFSRGPEREIEKTLSDFMPDIAGFSIRNLDSQSMLKLKNSLPETRKYVRMVKNRGIITVLGGTAFTTFPGEMLNFMDADYGIAGQGEKSFLQLVESIKNKSGGENIPGLVRRDKDKILSNPPVMDGYRGISPDWSRIDIGRYKRKSFLTPAAGVIIKTGCPYKCIFCNTRDTMGKEFAMRDFGEIIEDIKNLKRTFQVNSFFMNAICFNSPMDYAKGLLERIIKEHIGIRFMTRLYPIRDSYDDEFMSLYKKAGGYFTMVDFGSFSGKMLEIYKKPFNIGDILRFVSSCARHRLKFGAELLFGGPGETEQTIKESMSLLPEIDYSLIEYSLGIRIEPRTELAGIALKEGIIRSEGDLLFSKFYLSESVNIEWAKNYISKSVKKYSYRKRKMLPILIKNIMDSI